MIEHAGVRHDRRLAMVIKCTLADSLRTTSLNYILAVKDIDGLLLCLNGTRCVLARTARYHLNLISILVTGYVGTPSMVTIVKTLLGVLV